MYFIYLKIYKWKLKGFATKLQLTLHLSSYPIHNDTFSTALSLQKLLQILVVLSGNWYISFMVSCRILAAMTKKEMNKILHNLRLMHAKTPNSHRNILNSFIFAKITSNSLLFFLKIDIFHLRFLAGFCSSDKERNEYNFTQFKTHARQNDIFLIATQNKVVLIGHITFLSSTVVLFSLIQKCTHWILRSRECTEIYLRNTFKRILNGKTSILVIVRFYSVACRMVI